jgi:hypothetical protein
MIPVREQAEPANFGVLVRAPGEAFLRTNRSPKRADFSRHDYWRRALPDMKSKYSSTCAYSAMPVIGDASIDHFLPKTIYPVQAYMWSNYRLCMASLNGKKGNDQTVLDPFSIQPNWFHLDLASLFVQPNPDAPRIVQPRIRRTIDVLGLNSTTLITARFNIYAAYLRNGDLDFLTEFYPFIAVEVTRQATPSPPTIPPS